AAAVMIAILAAVAGIEIAGDEARGDAEAPQRLDHQERIVAAGAGSRLQRVERMLRAALMALAIGEEIADAMGHAAQDLERRRRRLRVEEAARPRRQLTAGIAIVRSHELAEIGEFLAVVEEGIEVSMVIRRQRELLRRIVVDRDG